MSKIQEYPTEFDMLQAFGVEPEESVPRDGFWCYEFDDTCGVKLKFSFDIFEGAVQTVISVEGRVVQTVSNEGSGFIKLEQKHGDTVILGTFQREGSQTNLVIHLQPSMTVEWSTLII